MTNHNIIVNQQFGNLQFWPTIMDNNTDGKNCVRRKDLEYIDQIYRDVGCSGYTQMKTLAKNKGHLEESFIPTKR